MEEEERKLKLKAGKEKLAKFQQKKRKRPKRDDEQLDQPVVQQDAGVSTEVGLGASALESAVESLSNFSEEEASGTESSAMQSPELPEYESAESPDNQSHTMLDNQSSEIQSHGIPDNQSSENQTEAGTQLYTMADVQELIQHVQWLQLQLKQAGTTLQAQNEKQAATTEALQQARTELLALQENMVTKDAIVTQLADRLTTISTEYCNLKASLSAQKDHNVPNGHAEKEESMQAKKDAEVSEINYIGKINELERELKAVQEKSDLEKEDLLKALSIVKENNEIMLKENQALQQDNEKVKHDLQSLSVEKDSIEQNFESAKLKLDEIITEFEKIKSEEEAIDQEKLKLSEQNSSLISELEQFETINSNLAVEMESLKNEKNAMEENVNKLSSDLDKARESIEDLEKRNSGLVTEVHELKAEKDDVNKELKQLYDEVALINAMKKDYENMNSELKEKVESLSQENESFQRNNESLGGEIETLVSQCQSHATQISDYQSQIEDYETKVSEANEAVEENRSLRTQNDDLYNKINNQKDIIAALKAEIEGVLCKNVQLVDQLQDSLASEELSRRDIVELENEKSVLKEETETLQESLTETKSENIKLKESINVLSSEIDTLKQALENSSRECDTYKHKFEEMSARKTTDEGVTEECFTKENVFRSEAVIQKSHTSVQHSYDDSTLISGEETFLTATDLSMLATSTSEDSVTGRTLLDNNSNSNNNADKKTDDSKGIDELLKENQVLKKELLKFQAGSIVANVLELAQNTVHPENDDLNQSEASEKLLDHTESSRESESSPCTVVSESYDDTAYQTYDTDGLTNIGASAETIDTVRKRLADLQEKYNNIKCALDDKTRECELLKSELSPSPDPDTHKLDSLVTDENRGAHFIEHSKVSGGVHRIDASGMAVNLHASPTLPSTLGFSSVINSSVGTVDEHVQFQDDFEPEETTRHSDVTRHFLEEIQLLKQRIIEQNQEKTELSAVLDKQRKKLEFATTETKECQDMAHKYMNDLENQNLVNKDLKEAVECLQNEIQGLNDNKESLEWYKNELQMQLSNMEKEVFDLKVERSSLEQKEEQITDDLKTLKDRLEYLEMSELDVVEMREVVDSIQVEKEKILKENEELLSLLESRNQECESYLKDVETLNQENDRLMKELKLSNTVNGELKSSQEKVTSELAMLKISMENSKERNCHLNCEIEGLVAENSTLKTKSLTHESEIQNLTAENAKLQSFFPNIDFQEEQLQSMTERCKHFEQELEEVRECNEKMVVEITDLEKKLMIVSGENELLLNKCDEMVAIIADMDNEKTELIEKNEALTVKLGENSTEMNIVLQKKESEIEALVEENSTLKTQVNCLKEDIREVDEQANRSEQNMRIEKKSQELEKKNAELENDIAEYQEKVNTLEYDVLELIEKIQLYDDTISEKADLASRLEHEINSLLEENSTLKTKNNILEHDLKEAIESQKHTKLGRGNAADAQQTFSEELSAQLELESKCKNKLQRDLEVLQVQNSQHESKIKNLGDENEMLRRELTLHKTDWLEKETYCQSLEAEKENLLKERDIFKEKINDIQNKQKGNLKQLETMTAELQTCHAHLQAVSDNRNHVRCQIEILAAESESLSASRDDAESRFNMLANEHSRLKSENEMAETLVKTLEKENGMLKTENEKLSRFMDSVQERIGKLDKILDKNAELASRNEILSNKIDEMESKVERVKIEKVELEKMMDELTNLLHDMQTKYEEVRSEMESTKKRYDKEIKQLQTQLQTMNDDVQDLRNMLDIMENEVYDANEEKQVLRENLEQRENQYEEVVETKQKLEEMLSEKHQKDVQNKRTACEQMTNRTNENNIARPFDIENVCERCHDQLDKSCVSTFTQTDSLLAEIPTDTRLSAQTAYPDYTITNQDIEFSVGALLCPSNYDADKDEDTQQETSENVLSDTHRMDNEIWTESTSDFECQTNFRIRADTNSFVVSKIETNSFIPSEAFEIEEAEQQILRKPYSNDADNCGFEVKESATMGNIPAQNIASEMLENEQSAFFSDQLCSVSVETSANVKDSLKFMDISIQTETIEEPKESTYEHYIETPSDTSHPADISVQSVDSGVFSAVTGPKFSFESPYVKQKQCNRNINPLKGDLQSNLSHFMYCSATTQTDDIIEYLDSSSQTDSNDDLEKELQEKYEAKCSELETKIEDKLKRQLEFRERKIKLQEEHFEEKVKQIEYEVEEKYEQNFRMREAEVMINVELDKKSYEKELEDIADRRIEQIRMEKDQQFVETMQKVRSDMKRRHKVEIGRLKEELRDASLEVGPGGDGGAKEDTLEQLQKLNEENKDLATVRDALLQRADTYSLQLHTLHLDLQNIMEGNPAPETPELAAGQGLPSWLDWEISPDLSFGSLNSSVDEKSLRGSLDSDAFCSKSDCRIVRRRYELLVERINKFLNAKRGDSSFTGSSASTPRAVISDTERGDTSQENIAGEFDSSMDRFVENTELEIPMIQRITSIHLEHSPRVPCSESENTVNDRHDQFVVEDVTDCKQRDELNENIIEQLIKESINLNKESGDLKPVERKKHSHSPSRRSRDIEGHFSENESDSEREDFSEGSVTIDYDQFESFHSESGKGVTDKNVHPFDECKYARSVIRRHMSENELSDDDEPAFRDRCQSDSRVKIARISDNSDLQKKVQNDTEADRLLVQNVEIKYDKVGSLDLQGLSGFDTVLDEVFSETDRSSVTEILPLERIETFEFPNKGILRIEQDKFIKEMSPMEENAPGATSSLDDSNNEKLTGEDRGDFFEEVPITKKKTNRQLMDLNFNFQSYSHSNEDLKEITEPEIVPLRKVETSMQPEFQGPGEYIGNRKSDVKSYDAHSAADGSQSIFVKHDSGDILENISMDPPPVSEERQSYENTIFDVLNSICPGTNPIRVNQENAVDPVFENFENTAHDFSESQAVTEIPELNSHIQHLEMEISAMKIENENLREQSRETELLQQTLAKQTEEFKTLQCQNSENQTELEKIAFLKESLDLQIIKLRKENESLSLVNASSQNEIQHMKVNSDALQLELSKIQNLEKEILALSAALSEAETEKEVLNNSKSQLTAELNKQEQIVHQLCQEKDRLDETENALQLKLEHQEKEYETNITAAKTANEVLKQKVTSALNKVLDSENENRELMEQMSRMKAYSVENELKVQDLKDQLHSSKQEKQALYDELECIRNQCKQDEEQVSHELKAVKEENVKYCKELEMSAKQNERYMLEIRDLKVEAEAAFLKQLSLEKQTEDIKLEYEVIKSRQEEMCKEEQKLTNMISELGLQKDTLSKTVSDLKDKLEAQENETVLIRNEKDKALYDRNQWEIKFEALKEDFEKKINEMSATVTELEQKLSLGSCHIIELEKEKHELEKQSKQMKDHASRNETELKETSSKLKSIEQKNDVLISENEELTNKLEHQESTCNLDKEHLNEKIKTLEDVNTSLHEKAHELKLQIDQINRDTESIIEKLDLKVNENKELYAVVQHLKSVVNKLKETISENMSENECLIEQSKALEAEKLSLKVCCEQAEAANNVISNELKCCRDLIKDQQGKLDHFETLLCEKQEELDLKEQTIGSKARQETEKDESSNVNNAEKLEKSTQIGPDLVQNSHVQESNLLKSDRDSLKDELRKSKEINEENEWAINELASQLEQLEQEKKEMNSKFECLSQENKQLNAQLTQTIVRQIEKLHAESQTETSEECHRNSSDQIHKTVVESLSMTSKRDYDEKLVTENEWQASYEASKQEIKSLSVKVQSLEKEKVDLNVLITYNREAHEKEKAELLEMYNDLKIEVDTLVESKKCLEDELQTLRELLENGVDLSECDKSRELTIEDLEEMEDLKTSIELLKSDIKEKDNYVKKLEEHLLNIPVDGGLPDLVSTPRPRASSGEPVTSKAFSQRKLSFHEFGRKHSHSDKAHDVMSNESKHGRKERNLLDPSSEHVDLDDSNNSTLSETKFLAELDKDSKDPFRSSVHSDIDSMSSVRDSFSSSDRIRSGLPADEDGHYALELKQFELVDEIAKLRKDFHETKAIYAQETALLTEALEREKASAESMKLRKAHVIDEKGDMGIENTLSTDLVRARQDIALLRRENNILRIENERWLNRIREQEQIVLDLRERLARNTSGIEEVEEVFGRQLALLQKQREELLDQVKDREQENSKLSITLGEKSIIEDSLRREKEILSAKLQEKADLEKELNKTRVSLEKQKMLQKQFEEVVYQKDLNERNLMKQKRLLEEELLEIESKFRDREENLGFEKNKLLDELREKQKKQKSEMAESQDDTRSVCSDSSISDQQIGRLELMLEEVEKQHKRAVKVLRDQLESKYSRREKLQREEYVGALRDLHTEQQNQVK